jgi:fructose-bisphosphate aldolase class I
MYNNYPFKSTGLVPIVEPEVLMDGSHTIAEAAAVQEAFLTAAFLALNRQGVVLSATLLKPSMTCPGASCQNKVCIQ